jgi:hypothetical protein
MGKSIYKLIKPGMKNLKLMMMTLMMSLVTIFMIGCNQKSSIKTEIEIDESDNIRQKQIEDSLKIVKQKQIKDSLKLVELETFKNAIEFVKYYTSKPNTAGGVDCNIIWKNLSEKTVKYAKFTVAPYNEVNDRVRSEHDYSGNGEKVVKVTGPVKSKQVNGNGTYWDCLWYNWSIDYMLITAIELEYVDGTKISTSDASIIEKLGYNRKPNK